jgi:hypothetical protein
MKLELEEKRLKEGERSAESINHGLLFHSLFPIVPCSFSYSFRIDSFLGFLSRVSKGSNIESLQRR